MAKIKVLTPQLANMIAAGEVVERPGSVAKELIENSVDGGADKIVVEIKNGGNTYLRISDNGIGIAPEEVRTAFLRHATSKISKESDLDSIMTLGFRGEALAAVSAVSKVEMITRTAGQTEGVRILIEGGEEKFYGEAGCPVGTTIVVRDLFYNVPARAKFLKKDATEAGYIEQAVMQAAITRPKIAFKLIKDGRESFSTPGDGKMLSAIHATAGRDVASSLIMTAGAFGDITIDGFITPPSVTRANRSLQNFYINGRFIRSRLLSAALDEAYKGRLMVGRHPVCFLNIRLSPMAVDVNVHPAKLEVKFAREREVFSAVYHCICSAFETMNSLENLKKTSPSLPLKQDNVTAQQTEIKIAPEPQRRPTITYEESHKSSFSAVASERGISYATKADTKTEQKIAPTTAPVLVRAEIKESEPDKIVDRQMPVQQEEKNDSFEPIVYIGQLLSTYIMAQDSSGVWLIDKHAAHERIVYNELKSKQLDQSGQLLLEPTVLTLAVGDKTALMEHKDLLERTGFDIDDFGVTSVVVRQVPMYLKPSDMAFVLTDLAGKLANGNMAHNEVLDNLLKSIACKAAVKGGQFNDHAELEKLAQDVMNMPNVRNCPHGRPVAVYMSKAQLEKLFGRIQ